MVSFVTPSHRFMPLIVEETVFSFQIVDSCMIPETHFQPHSFWCRVTCACPIAKLSTRKNFYQHIRHNGVQPSWCSEIGSLTSLMHVTQVHPVTTENQFYCTKLYKQSQTARCFPLWNMHNHSLSIRFYVFLSSFPFHHELEKVTFDDIDDRWSFTSKA